MQQQQNQLCNLCKGNLNQDQDMVGTVMQNDDSLLMDTSNLSLSMLSESELPLDSSRGPGLLEDTQRLRESRQYAKQLLSKYKGKVKAEQKRVRERIVYLENLLSANLESLTS